MYTRNGLSKVARYMYVASRGPTTENVTNNTIQPVRALNLTCGSSSIEVFI